MSSSSRLLHHKIILRVSSVCRSIKLLAWNLKLSTKIKLQKEKAPAKKRRKVMIYLQHIAPSS